MFNLAWQTWLGWAATVLFSACYIPQIWKTFRTKHVEDVSLWQWVIQLIGYTCALFYGFHLREPVLMTGYSWGFLCSVGFLLLYYRAVRYQNNLRR